MLQISTMLDKIYGQNAQYQQKNQHHKRTKTTAYDLSSRSKSFGLGWDLRLRILGLMVEWSGEQPSTQFPSGTSVFRMCWPFRSKSSTFRVLGKYVFLLILCIWQLFYVQDCVWIFYFARFLLHNCFQKRIKRIFLKELMVFFHLRPRKWSFVEFCTLKFEFLTFQCFSSTENYFFGSKHEIMYSQAA